MVALIIAMPGYLKVIPSMILFVILITVWIFIGAQDPRGPGFIPAFIRQKLKR